jgi:hypothetical protein
MPRRFGANLINLTYRSMAVELNKLECLSYIKIFEANNSLIFSNKSQATSMEQLSVPYIRDSSVCPNLQK